MSTKMIHYVKQYIHEVITGFESGLYKMISCHPENLKYLSDKNQPFITLLKGIHEKYYTTTFNSFISRDDEYVNHVFDRLQSESDHSKQCLLNILSNLIVTIHFSIRRESLDHSTYDAYIKSVYDAIEDTIMMFDIKKLFDHECHGLKDHQLTSIPEGQNFITIQLTVEKKHDEPLKN